MHKIKLFALLTLAMQLVNAQGPTSLVGDRENIGLFGGPADDLAWHAFLPRVFGGLKSPATLFYSDDTSKTWNVAFPIDSVEFALGTRGWGGGAFRVLTNQKGWVFVHTGYMDTNLSAAVVSYNGGITFQTAVDPFLLRVVNHADRKVHAIELTDHYCYAGMGEYLIRINDTTGFTNDQVLLKADTLQGVQPGAKIVWIAASNDPSGYPVYFVVSENNGNGRLFKSYGNILFELGGLPVNYKFINVFDHPAHINGDTVIVSAMNTITSDFGIFRSLIGGFGWTNITPPMLINTPLSDADFSPAWIQQMPQSYGLRLSFPGGLLSDNLGNTWQVPSSGLLQFGIATHPLNTGLVLGSNNTGVMKSDFGISGPFFNTTNIGFTRINVNDFDESQGIYYVATDAGLGYTSEYFNPLINGYEQWIPPNGLFPVPNVAIDDAVTSVAIDPFDSLHVICGYGNGFYVTFNGPSDFTPVTPSLWNNNLHLDLFVCDILFVNSNIVLAVTGQKHRNLSFVPQQPVGNIWRSVNGGMSWDLVTPYNPDEFLMGNCLAIRFNGPGTMVYAGSGYDDMAGNSVPGALWHSADLGFTWSKLNNGPLFQGGGQPLPVFDIDIDPFASQIMYFSAGRVIARSNNGGLSYFITDIPYNTGSFTSALIDPVYPDSIIVTAGRNIYKYNFQIDDADLKFRGLPGEFFTCSDFGSVLGGSNTGASEITEAPTYFLELKIFTEGAFNGTDLNTSLNTFGYLPLNQPFNQPPWNYNGTESVSAIPNIDVADWVLLELRKTTGDSSTATAETQFDRKALFLLKDGTLVDDDGANNPRFSIILQGTKDSEKVHGVVYSPSHVEERTSSEMSAAKSLTFSYDFTSGPNQAYGGSNAHKEISPGVWGMICGDGNHNGQVDNADKNQVWLPEAWNNGYFFGDFNRDGSVDLTDLNDYWKPNAGRGSKLE